MRPVRLVRAAVAAATVGTVVALTSLPAASVSASPGFTCTPQLAQACSIVFGPLCKPTNCY
jgi:hypothetical protein